MNTHTHTNTTIKTNNTTNTITMIIATTIATNIITTIPTMITMITNYFPQAPRWRVVRGALRLATTRAVETPPSQPGARLFPLRALLSRAPLRAPLRAPFEGSFKGTFKGSFKDSFSGFLQRLHSKGFWWNLSPEPLSQ